MKVWSSNVNENGKRDVDQRVEKEADRADNQSQLNAGRGGGQQQKQYSQHDERRQQHRFAAEAVGEMAHDRLRDRSHRVKQRDVNAENERGVPEALLEIDGKKGDRRKPAHLQKSGGRADAEKETVLGQGVDFAQLRR